ncbi:hypothetical protein NE237_011491 [Protea cynaroides]|uniref:SP-RING-type domain-containing protein n=1 Tax=Protea cynaroides TaxID=273540 RepID=A0A9Q0JYB3_9MAGN|nr:hypothetical protein NE237_011491 [Protea cynaroides]
MAGAVFQRQPGSSTGGAGQNSTSSPMYIKNSFRVSAVATRLAMHITGHRTDPNEFFQLCIALARGIDYAVANNEVPARAHELPIVLRQVCHRKTIFSFQAVIMVLMVSVKNACKNGWFPGQDNEELLTLANEILGGFCSLGDVNIESNSTFSTISEIMSRFYPRMKMGNILASLEVKPGYGAYVIDFNIPMNTNFTEQGKIRLFVAQMDSTETSSCIITPPLVNFLLNGKGVERRINVSMDNGPQFPTNVTPLLKFGINLLQVIGQFNGNYIIVIAFMNVISSPGTPVLQDYVQPVAAVDSDSDVIEGPSRLSLNCPISHTRIRTPVKGHLCKHHQCFDYNNFLEINSRRPSWRCPHCNQFVCYTDIRIDQNMVKVLKEVAESVSDVIISVDGSWKAVCEGNDQEHQPHSGTLSCENDGPEQHEFSKNPAYVMDLTGEDDEGYTANLCETEDRKPFRDNFHSYSVATNLTVPLAVNTPEVVPNSATQIEDDFWQRIFLSTSSATLGQVASSNMVDAHVAGVTSESTPTNFMPSPVLTDATSPALNREAADAQGSTQLTISVQPDQFSAPYMQLQPSQFSSSIVSGETGRPAIHQNLSRSPTAIQALPAQTQVPNSIQRPQTNLNSLLPTGAPSSMQHPLVIQSWDYQQRPHVPTQSLPQGVGLPPTSQVGGYYRSSYQQQQRPPNLRLTQNMNWPSNMVRPFTHHFPRTQVQQGGVQGVGLATGSTTYQHVLPIAPALRPAQMPRPPTVPVQVQLRRAGSSLAMPMEEQRGRNMVQDVSRSDVSPEQNWRPTGRMRGSLVGGAYSAALSQFMGQPTPPAQVYGPAASQSSTPSGWRQQY